jgi:hypothetical protein
MNTEPNQPTDSHSRLSEIIARYLEAEEQGQRPNRAELLAQNPDLTEQLQAFFANHDLLANVSEPLRAPRTPSPSEAASIAPDQTGVSASLGKVRYFGDYELIE